MQAVANSCNRSDAYTAGIISADKAGAVAAAAAASVCLYLQRRCMFLEVCAHAVNHNDTVRLCKLPYLLWKLLLQLRLLLLLWQMGMCCVSVAAMALLR
jgi:hypothetical protein